MHKLGVFDMAGDLYLVLTVIRSHWLEIKLMICMDKRVNGLATGSLRNQKPLRLSNL